MILLPDTLLSTKGDTLTCHFELVQDKVQHRRYNITIQLDEEEEEDEEEGEEGEGEEDHVEVDMQDDIRSHVLKALEAQNEQTSAENQ